MTLSRTPDRVISPSDPGWPWSAPAGRGRAQVQVLGVPAGGPVLLVPRG